MALGTVFAQKEPMLSAFEKLLIWRYLLPGAEGRIIVLVAGIGLTAVTIGVAALIIVMSVMNGARTKLAIQFAGVDGHASISRPGAQLADWRELEAEARRQAGVVSAVPALDAAAMASVEGRVLPAAIRGLRPKDMRENPLFEGDGRFFLGFLPREDEDVVVGSQLAAALGITIGSPITIVRPAMEPEGQLSLKSISYVVTGLVHTGIPKHDAGLVVMNLSVAQQLLDSGDVASRINISTASPDRVSEQLAPLEARLQGRTVLQTWRELNKPIFDALALEHIGMFIAVSMIVLVAQFNILSSLMMLVGSKLRDIAIMRTMGASRASILKIFVAVGTTIGSSGALLGSILGLSAVSAKDDIVAFLKAHVLRDSYTMELAVLIDLPARISAGETAGILVMTLAGTILATLYPAFRAANVDPATVLRHEAAPSSTSQGDAATLLLMREKELRLALICYGGISLAVYMHGITKEIWQLAKASQSYHAGSPPPGGSEAIYRRLLHLFSRVHGIELRVLVDILAGASAGGINAIFLADAISNGHSLDPLTDLWLDNADVDTLLDPSVSAMSRVAKAAAVPIAWAMAAKRGGAVEQTVEADHRDEVRTKLAHFVRARWFAPPFAGPGFTGLLLDALEAMRSGERHPPLLPRYQPLDLFVTVTDFHGYPQRLRLNSPEEVVETEHRLTIAFRDEGSAERRLADPAELVFAGRATASFPGAFPPFQVKELDQVLESRGQSWPGRAAFLARALPGRSAPESAVLIDGSVLANAPFRPAIDALQNRPARRDVDRRFVYIDPKPGVRSVRLGGGDVADTPGFFATIFGALSDIPREQPIRDNLEAIDGRSARIRRLRHIVEAMRPEVEAAIERLFGTTLLLGRPTPKRLAAWRTKAQQVAARQAGYAYAAYGHLKVAAVTEEIASALFRLSGGGDRQRQEVVRQSIWETVRSAELTAKDAMTSAGARPHVVDFLRSFDLTYRIRRLRSVARRLTEIAERHTISPDGVEQARAIVYDLIGRYRSSAASVAAPEPPPGVEKQPAEAMQWFADRLDLKSADDEADLRLSEALSGLPKIERRSLILAYLGFPFYDIATLPLLQGEGLDEFDPVKVDRISPDDAVAIRRGGAGATLKGVQFNSFGAFFSRAYRENDYLWGRLHGADRLIDILVSTLPEGTSLPDEDVAALKRDAFRAIVEEERPRLTQIGSLFEELNKEIGASGL